MSRRFFILCMLASATTAAAQGSLPLQNRSDEIVGETVADRPSPYYDFERHVMQSADGRQRYRIEIAQPKRRAPEAGHPVLYMLDGNAAMAAIGPEDLQAAFADDSLVLVAMGYDVPTRNDVVARAYDYTPPVHQGADLVTRPTVRGRIGGGADHFLDFIRNHVKPLVESRVAIDHARETLWGHSYGGLFALYTLFTEPDAFDQYVAGGPSFWWHDGALLWYWKRFVPSRSDGKKVAILMGTRPRHRPANDARAAEWQRMTEAVDRRALVEQMTRGLRAGGADVHARSFEQHGHGEMLRVSLEHALRAAHGQ